MLSLFVSKVISSTLPSTASLFSLLAGTLKKPSAKLGVLRNYLQAPFMVLVEDIVLLAISLVAISMGFLIILVDFAQR